MFVFFTFIIIMSAGFVGGTELIAEVFHFIIYGAGSVVLLLIALLCVVNVIRQLVILEKNIKSYYGRQYAFLFPSITDFCRLMRSFFKW